MKNFSVLLFIIFLSCKSFSQNSGKPLSVPSDLKYGVRLALGQSSFRESLGGTQNDRLAFNVGLATYFQATTNFALSADLHLCSKGTRISGSDSTSSDYLRTFRLLYAEMPILARYSYPLTD